MTHTDKATPRPWEVLKTSYGYSIDHNNGKERNCFEEIVEAGKVNKANAELIVKAVNNHAALLEACREALKCLENPPTDNTYCINQLSQAIANAENK